MQPQYITLHQNAKDLTGQRFGRLVALGPVGRTASHNVIWSCECDCGSTVVVPTSNLNNGHTQSCGCLRADKNGKSSITHGLSRHPLYRTWKGVIQRCTNPNHPRYADYGGRGISICDDWRNSFESFHAHVTALPNYGTKGYSLDRTDNDGNYEPGNVRWLTRNGQRRNTRTSRIITFNGKTQCLWDWAQEVGINDETLRSRLERGWDIADALTTPV